MWIFLPIDRCFEQADVEDWVNVDSIRESELERHWGRLLYNLKGAIVFGSQFL